jgi:hypothetical protein
MTLFKFILFIRLRSSVVNSSTAAIFKNTTSEKSVKSAISYTNVNATKHNVDWTLISHSEASIARELTVKDSNKLVRLMGSRFGDRVPAVE